MSRVWPGERRKIRYRVESGYLSRRRAGQVLLERGDLRPCRGSRWRSRCAFPALWTTRVSAGIPFPGTPSRRTVSSRTSEDVSNLRLKWAGDRGREDVDWDSLTEVTGYDLSLASAEPIFTKVVAGGGSPVFG